MIHTPRDTGWIEVICGPMFSGKTEELIRRLKRAFIARQKVQVFRPRIDDRYAETAIASHEGRTMEAHIVDSVEDIRAQLLPDVQVVGVDEVQFFAPEVVDLCDELATSGIRVIAAGLDQDYLAQPFHPVPHLMAVAEFVTKAMAICVLCGNPAIRSHRTVFEHGAGQVQVGATESYQPLCRRCYAQAREEADARASQTSLPLSRDNG